MTPLAREILDKWQVRKTKAQKTAFIEWLQSSLPDLKVEEGGFPRCRNLVLGDPESAKLVFTAHYDTCARLPFPNIVTPKNLLFYLFYNLLIALPFLLLLLGLEWLFLAVLNSPFGLFLPMLIALGLMFYVFLGGPPNPHTANDNTSGVVTLVELYQSLGEEERAQAAFVFFDHEESGLIGSAVFAGKHRKSMKNKLLVNFDCVSDGDDFLIVQSGRARRLWGGAIRDSFLPTPDKQVHLESGWTAFYPSDQANFRTAIAVAAMQRKPLLGLCMGRIHTPRDTAFQEENIRWLCESGRRLCRMAGEREA